MNEFDLIKVKAQVYDLSEAVKEFQLRLSEANEVIKQVAQELNLTPGDQGFSYEDVIKAVKDSVAAKGVKAVNEAE